jgi:hypothetical protein
MESKMDVKFKSVHILIALVLVLSGCGSSDKSAPLDTDGDGVADASDAFPQDARETLDSDGDGMGNNADVFPILMQTPSATTAITAPPSSIPISSIPIMISWAISVMTTMMAMV